MICPSCNAEMHTDRTHADWACECGLAGPRDVLEALAARLGPAGILDAAQCLLEHAKVQRVSFGMATFSPDDCSTVLHFGASAPEVVGDTLAQAYAKLTGGRHG